MQFGVFCAWLPRCGACRKLYLNNNSFADAGIAVLAEAAARPGALPALKRLFLKNNRITDAGIAALAEAAAKPGALQKLEQLWLGNNPITEAGAGSLARALEAGALPALTELLLPASAKGNADLERVAASRAGLRVAFTMSWKGAASRGRSVEKKRSGNECS